MTRQTDDERAYDAVAEVEAELRQQFVQVTEQGSARARPPRKAKLVAAAVVTAIVLPAGWAVAREVSDSSDDVFNTAAQLESGEIGTPLEGVRVHECPGAAEKYASVGIEVDSDDLLASCEVADRIVEADKLAAEEGISLPEAAARLAQERDN